jgi:hypothetical protein
MSDTRQANPAAVHGEIPESWAGLGAIREDARQQLAPGDGGPAPAPVTSLTAVRATRAAAGAGQ